MKPKTFLNQGHRYIWRDGKKIAEHRAIMEDHLGHPIGREEVVHHIDGDPLNNDLANLTMMTRADHLILHLRVMPIEPWTADEEEAAIRLSGEGNPIEYIAQKLGKGYYAVRRRLARARKQGRL
jgi:DNA-directed RNA polymerase specialized sigma24 family protein